MISFLDLKKLNASFQPELQQAINRVTDSGWYLLGEEVKTFEKDYARYIGTAHAVGCANGLDALSLILKAYIELGVMSPGDEVIVPANTYIASFLAITDNGLVPIPVEPDASTYQIDPSRIEAAITERTRAVMIVHLYGRCAYTEEIGEICRQHNLKLIEDNAQAHGCLFGNRHTGALGNAAGHSFYPGKNLGALGDGGIVTTDDAELAQMVRTLAFYGSSKKYVFDYRGKNSRLDEIQAAVLKVKLPRLDRDNMRRREIASRYLSEIKNPKVKLPYPKDTIGGDNNVFHIFPIFCEHRDELQEHLTRNGIQTLIHYPIPPHLQQCYAREAFAAESFPITEKIHHEELSLPMSPLLTDAEIDQVIAAINSFQYG